MTAAERLEQALRAPKHPERPALMPFLTAGYPQRDGFAALLGEVAEFADAIELGVPFTDPMADGVTIQGASHQALADGVSLRWILGMLRESSPQAPVILMSYLNPLLAYGLEQLVVDAAEAGVSGFIVPDLTYEESSPFRALVTAQGLALIQLVTPVTPPERLEQLCAASSGFVYAVTVAGITGADSLPTDLSDYLDRVRSVSSRPVCAGFGIRTAEDVLALTGHADGAIVGSALLDVLGRGEDPMAFLRGLIT